MIEYLLCGVAFSLLLYWSSKNSMDNEITDPWVYVFIIPFWLPLLILILLGGR